MQNKDEIRWTVEEAMAEAAKRNIFLSSPTIIKLCRDNSIGYQPGGKHSKWLIYPDKFIAIISGPQQKELPQRRKVRT